MERQDDDDGLDGMITKVTKEILKERELDGRVKTRGIERNQDSDRLALQLVEKTGPKESAFHWLHVDPTEVLDANKGVRATPETLRPFIRKELLRLFPE
jgi:hypothetical protein